MRVDALHRRIVDDVKLMHAAVAVVLPPVLPSQYLARSMSLRHFLDRINEVTAPFGVFNELQPDMEIDPGMVVNTGLWIGEDELPENGSPADIRVMWHVHPATKRIRMSQAEWNRRRYYWWQMVMHEMVHRHQDVYRTKHQDIRTFRPRSTRRSVKVEQEYYGNYDEIESHAHDAAVEFYVWWQQHSLREAIHEALTYSGRIVIPTYNAYMFAFAESPKHPAVKVFRRKLKAWYDVIRKNPEIYQLLELPKLT